MQNDPVLHQRVTKGLKLPRVISQQKRQRVCTMTDIHVTYVNDRQKKKFRPNIAAEGAGIRESAFLFSRSSAS